MNNVFVLAAGILLVAACSAGCIEDGGESGETVTMTLGEFSDDYVRSTDNATRTMTDMLSSLEPGDVLLLRDTITNMTYLPGVGYTQVEFASRRSVGFPIAGDVTTSLAVGDTVEATLHIIAVTYTEELRNGTWTFKQEYFREGWDAKNESFAPVPRASVRRVSQGTVVTMTMAELIADYDYSYDNATKTITNMLTSLNEGDILIVNDTLSSLDYRASAGYTVIDFATKPGYTFHLKGDLTGSYAAGDNVTMTLHIIRVTTTEMRNGTWWTVEEETFKEGWKDGEYVPIPQRYLSHG